MSHVAHRNVSCHTCEWVMSHLFSPPKGAAEKWAMPHISTSHVAQVNESCRTYECVMSHMWTRHISLIQSSKRRGRKRKMRDRAKEIAGSPFANSAVTVSRWLCSKSPISGSKEPYISTKRALYLSPKSPTSEWKEPYISVKKTLYLGEKSPISQSKEPYIWV